MYFSPNKRTVVNDQLDEHTLQLNGSEILRVCHTKFLGVIIDDKLSWQPHIDHLIKKMACCTGTLNRIKDNIPPHLHKDLYHTLFESHLSYCITVWGTYHKTKLNHCSHHRKNVSVSCSVTRRRILTSLKLVPGLVHLNTRYWILNST